MSENMKIIILMLVFIPFTFGLKKVFGGLENGAQTKDSPEKDADGINKSGKK